MPSAKSTPESVLRYGHIAAVLRQEMAKRGWSASELSRQIGTNSTSIASPWLHGRGAPGPQYRKMLAKLFNLDEAAFIPKSDEEIASVAPVASAAPRAGPGRPSTRARAFNFALYTDGTAQISLDLHTSKEKALELLRLLLEAGIEPEAATEDDA